MPDHDPPDSVVIEQAKGVLMHLDGSTAAQAEQELHRRAEAKGRPVAEIAAAVVSAAATRHDR